MKKHFFVTVIIFLGLGILSIIGNLPADAAVALTKKGPREGKIIVREFDRLVITIVTPEKRVFQYYARDVESITAPMKVLIGEKTPLRKEPNEKAETVTDFSRGLEIGILEKSPDGEWVKVKGWGNNEGWIPVAVLTDKVVFTPEERQETKPQPAAAAVQPATPTLQPATPTLQTATPTAPAAPAVAPAVESATPAAPTAAIVPSGTPTAPIVPNVPVAPSVPSATGSDTILGASAAK